MRLWKQKGMRAAIQGKDMYIAWAQQKGKPKIPGKLVDAQEAFFEAYQNQVYRIEQAKRGNPQKAKLGKWIKAKQVRFLPRGIVQIKR